jgi:ABC-type Zn2+ transport system substrate-binding protein/surface adhesin
MNKPTKEQSIASIAPPPSGPVPWGKTMAQAMLADMLRAMHLTVVTVNATFEPEGGAYASGGHAHGHGHSHDHGHDHGHDAHAHGHDHGHEH